MFRDDSWAFLQFLIVLGYLRSTLSKSTSCSPLDEASMLGVSLQPIEQIYVPLECMIYIVGLSLSKKENIHRGSESYKFKLLGKLVCLYIY